MAPIGIGGRRAASQTPVDLRYSLAVNGVTVAEISFGMVAGLNGVSTRLGVRPRGLGALMAGSTLSLASTSGLTATGAEPITYEAHQEKRDRTRDITIRYDEAGEIASLVYLNRGRPTASEVPLDLRRGTVDPLTGYQRLAAWLREARAGTIPNTTSVAIFDGRKLLDYEAEYLGRAELRLGQRAIVANQVKLLFRARHGFGADDPLVAFPGDTSPRWLKIWVTTGNDVLPLRAESVNARNDLVIELTAGCPADLAFACA